MGSTWILIACSLAFLVLPGINGSCRSPMVEFQASCYLYVHQPEDFVSAMEVCREFDGYLVEIHSAAEDTFLVSLINNVTAPGSNPDVWTGGNDMFSEGRWTWLNSGIKFTYTNWHPGNPSNSWGQENCMQLHLSGGVHKWNDRDCLHKTYFICESESSTDPGVIG
ncbi:perlucin-like [Gigantopelta aegis]|uniref:perlucin-like n=1 Tax=Gigantopelta aegis TaxID=1735272 RepID=UPI001B887BB7|nr:perlucin-like [Gigantopelta aegis]